MRQRGFDPAVLVPAGHTQEGKAEVQIVAANLAAKGYIALAYDPIGQGEREQTYLPLLGSRQGAGGQSRVVSFTFHYFHILQSEHFDPLMQPAHRVVRGMSSANTFPVGPVQIDGQMLRNSRIALPQDVGAT